MFEELMRFVRHHDPRCVILENVPGLVNHDEGRTLKRIVSDLEERSYNVLVDMMACSDYGIPQSLGCIELPLVDAAKAWPYLAYGTLVTIVN